MANKQKHWQTHLDAWRQSGLSQASAINRNGRSRLTEIAGHALAKWVVTMDRDTQLEQGSRSAVTSTQKAAACTRVAFRPDQEEALPRFAQM